MLKLNWSGRGYEGMMVDITTSSMTTLIIPAVMCTSMHGHYGDGRMCEQEDREPGKSSPPPPPSLHGHHGVGRMCKQEDREPGKSPPTPSKDPVVTV